MNQNIIIEKNSNNWWKTCSFKEFEKHFQKVLIKLYKETPQDNEYKFIPTKTLLTKVFKTYPSYEWRRDLVTKNDGIKKLLLIEEFLNKQEMDLTNLLIRNANKGYIYLNLLSTYYGKWNTIESPDIRDTNETKAKINIEINSTGKISQEINKLIKDKK